MQAFNIILGFCFLALTIAEDVTLPTNSEAKLVPQKKGERFEGQWKVTTSKDSFLIISCGITSSAFNSCKDKILIKQNKESTEVCVEGKNTFHVQDNKDTNEAELIILTNTPKAFAECTVYSILKPKDPPKTQ
uniref:Venom CUB domain protein 1 n=1 Tax=Oncocephalus sp. TaxID=2944721 RepID=A0AB38ZEH2_9HEMI